MSGLFDAPFLYQPDSVKIPLRRRENDAFTSPTRRRRRLYPDHNSNSSNSNDQWCLKTAMKAILVSPIVVIILWSLMAMLFTHNIRTNRNQFAAQAQQRQSFFRNNKSSGQPPYRNSQLAVQLSPVQLEQLQQQQQQPSATATATQKNGQQYYHSFPNLQQKQQQQLYGAVMPIAEPEQPYDNSISSEQQQQQQLPVLVAQEYGQKQYYYSFPNEPQQLAEPAVPLPLVAPTGALPVVSSEPQQLLEQTAQQQRRNPMQFQRQQLQQQQGDVAGDYTMNGGLMTNDPAMITVPPPNVLPPPLVEDAAVPPLMGRSHHLHHSNYNSQRRQRPGVRYFYYDPQAVTRDAQGQVLFLPNVVYDATTGQAVALQSLSTTTQNTRIRLEEPPPRTILHHNVTTTNDDDTTTTTTSNFTHPNTVHTVEHRKQQQSENPMMQRTGSISIPDSYYTWGASHVSDSSVIVVTVGVMALLVGALSARKLRSKSMLSSCIENETLEDDAAYDAAYTTHQYNTFQQGWKGDLEKFDV